MTSPAVAEQYADIKVSPRVRMAALLYSTGACKTKTEAARVAGVTKEYFVNMTNHNNELKRLSGGVQEMIEDESIQTSVIISKLSRRALGRIADLMDSPNDGVALKAAVDLADRGPDTSKTQKFQVDGLTMNGEDARALAAAMVEAAGVSQRYAGVAKDGLVEVDTDKRTEPEVMKLLPAGKGTGIG